MSPQNLRLNGRVLYVVNRDSFFLSHYLSLARAARSAGAEVYVATTDTGRAHLFPDFGLNFCPLDIDRTGLNPFRELRTCLNIARVFRSTRPDIVHLLTTKPLAYGSVIARLLRTPAVVGTVTGRGYAFSAHHRARCARMFLTVAYGVGFGCQRVRAVFQNPDDRAWFLDRGIIEAARTMLVAGAGVDCSRFDAGDDSGGRPLVLMASRLIADKGVREFVAAAALVRSLRPDVRFVLCGALDPESPDAIPPDELETLVRQEVVEYWGCREDMPEVLAQAHLVVLPTFYGEGIPLALIEGAASGRALIASDIPGCREIVSHGENGLLIPPRDSQALAEAILELIGDAPRRRRMGRAGRKIASARFSSDLVLAANLSLYDGLLNNHEPHVASAAALQPQSPNG